MLYPILPECHTQPLITVSNITLRNITSDEGWLPPGIIRCNATNPCSGFVFDNVQVKGWFNKHDLGYITENVQGVSINSYPDPGFSAPGEPLRENFEWTTHIENFILNKLYRFFEKHWKDIKGLLKHLKH